MKYIAKNLIHFLFQSHRMQCCTVQRKLSAICVDPLSSYGWQPICNRSQSERSCHITGCRHRRPIYMVLGDKSSCYGGKNFLTGNGDYGKVWYVPSASHLSCILLHRSREFLCFFMSINTSHFSILRGTNVASPSWIRAPAFLQLLFVGN
jgi:hypothetical protein